MKHWEDKYNVYIIATLNLIDFQLLSEIDFEFTIFAIEVNPEC